MGSNYPASKFIMHVMKWYCEVNTRSNGAVLVSLQRVYCGASFLPVSAHQHWWLRWCPEPTDREEPLTWKLQSSTAPVSIQFAPISLEPGEGMVPGWWKLWMALQSTVPLQQSLLRCFCSSFSLPIEQYMFSLAMNQSMLVVAFA